MNKTTIREDVDAILTFLDRIGIEYKVEAKVKGAFAPHIEIRNGVVHFDYDQVFITNLLHESGHLALVLKEHRHLLSGNLYGGLRKYTSMINMLDYNDPRLQILMSCDDPQVTAWSWAVGQKLGLDPKDVINDESYGGEGEGFRLTLSLSDRSPMPYIGVSMLHHAGFTKKFNRFSKQLDPDALFYPHMNYWTIDEALLKNNFSLNISNRAA